MCAVLFSSCSEVLGYMLGHHRLLAHLSNSLYSTYSLYSELLFPARARGFLLLESVRGLPILAVDGKR